MDEDTTVVEGTVIEEPETPKEPKKDKIRNIFCTKEQKETDHVVTIDANGEFVLTCSSCKSFIKLPGELKKEDIDKALKAHKDENEGKVTLEAQEKINDEKLKNI